MACLALLPGHVLTTTAAPLRQEGDPIVAVDIPPDTDATPTAALSVTFAPLFISGPTGTPTLTPTSTVTASLISTLSPTPTLTSTPTSTPIPAQTLTAEQRAQIDRVVQLTNAEREKKGLVPLRPNPNLMKVAQDYAAVLAPGPCFDHDCPPVPSPMDRALNAGYAGFVGLGENIAAGYDTPAAVVRGWMESPGHRVNILKPDFREIGVGVSTGSGEYGIYWVQDFGTRRE
jgi:uncharacterized protein YkwD